MRRDGERAARHAVERAARFVMSYVADFLARLKADEPRQVHTVRDRYSDYRTDVIVEYFTVGAGTAVRVARVNGQRIWIRFASNQQAALVPVFNAGDGVPGSGTASGLCACSPERFTRAELGSVITGEWWVFGGTAQATVQVWDVFEIPEVRSRRTPRC